MTRQTTAERSFTLETPSREGPRPPWERIWLDELNRSERRSRPSPAAIRSSLPPDLARREVAVARTPEGWAFAGVRRVVHPLTHLAETSVNRFAATAEAAANLLLDGLDRRGLLSRCSTEVDVLPDHRHGALASHGFAQRVLILRHDTTAVAPAAPAHALDIHPVRPGEAGFVVECLATALARGLGGDQSAVDLAEWARARYPLEDPATMCVVGTWDGRPVCHGLGRGRVDRHGAGPVLYIVDVFVVPGYQGRGLSQMVSTALMGMAAEQGYQVAESDVVLRPGSDGLLERLRRAGWAEDRVRWSRG